MEDFESVLGEDALKLERAATKYDERSMFQGFLKAYARNRSIDEYRAESKKPLHKSSSLEDEPGNEPLQEESSEASVINKDLKAKLLQLFTDRQRSIYEKKSQDKTDQQIGEELGIRRETVTRERKKMKDIGKQLVS